MKKIERQNQVSSSIEPSQSFDWQSELPALMGILAKSLSSYYHSDNKQDKVSSSVHPLLQPQDETPSLPLQAQKEFDRILCNLYISKHSMEEILKIVETEYNKSFTLEQLYLSIDRVATGYRSWRSHGLDDVYPIVWVLPYRFKVVDDKGIYTNHFMYTLLSVDREGIKDVIGTWIPRRESSSFWVSVFTELKNRGLLDIMFLSASNTDGIHEAVSAVYPHTVVIPNVALLTINLTKHILSKDRTKFSIDVRRLFSQSDESSGKESLSSLEENWSKSYPMVVEKVKSMWKELAVFYEYDSEIRSFATSRDAFTKLYDAIRKSFSHKGFFPSDEIALKLVYLSVENLKKKWTAPVMNWGKITQSIARRFGLRYPFL